MKKRLSGLLAIVLIFSLFPAVPLRVKAATEGVYTYTTSSSGATITDVDQSKTGTLRVPATLGGYPVRSVANYAFQGCNLSKIILPEGVISIGQCAFEDCRLMTEITLPSTLTSIGGSAFNDCVSLTEIIIPEGVTKIPYGAFFGCEKLKNVVIPKSVLQIEANVFYNCRSIESMTIPFVGQHRNADLEKTAVFGYLFGAGQTEQYFNATDTGKVYYNVPATLTTVTVTDATQIPFGAFSNCVNLRNITVNEGIKAVGRYAVFNSGWYNAQPEGMVYLGKVAHTYKGTVPETVTIREGTIALGSCVFYQSKGLKELILPDSVKTIASNAFRGCANLERINLPEGLVTIEDTAFYDCTGLQEITLPSTLTTIGSHAFYGAGLQEITIPDSLTSMGNWAFAYCRNLETAVIRGMRELPAYAFYGCSKLQAVAISKYLWNVGYYTFYDCDSLDDVWYPGTYTDRLDKIESESGNTDLFNARWHYNACTGAHSYAGICDRECAKCGWVRVTEVDHTYTNACDTACNVCYTTRVITHVYDNACDSVCNICNATRSITHSYDNGCDSICNVCSSVRSVPDHVYDNACDAFCNECGAGREVPAHVYDHGCDGDCNVCGTERTIPGHSYTWVEDVAATCGDPGVKHEECTVCQDVRKEKTPIEPTGDHSFENIQDTLCDVCGQERVLTGIKIFSIPTETVYKEGKDTLNTSGGNLTLFYDNGDQGYLPIGLSMVTGFNNARPGQQTLTVSYGGFTDTYTVTIQAKKLVSIVLTQLPEKLTYLEGEAFEPAGMVITAYYDNGTSQTVNDYGVNGYYATPGTKNLLVTYQGCTAGFTVEVLAKSLTAIAITQLPEKLTYRVGMAFEPAGMVVTGYYDNGTSAALEDYTVSGYDPTPGTKTVTVTCGAFSASFMVEVTHLPGDLNTDDLVNTDDVVVLLLHVSMPDVFTLPEGMEADFTKDGAINTDDVVTLLLHVSMPDMFPL